MTEVFRGPRVVLRRAEVGDVPTLVLARHLFDERGHHRLVIDPAAANTRAIRAYERGGFSRPLGRSYGKMTIRTPIRPQRS